MPTYACTCIIDTHVRCAGSPIPESCRSFGVSIAPAQTITSEAESCGARCKDFLGLEEGEEEEAEVSRYSTPV